MRVVYGGESYLSGQNKMEFDSKFDYMLVKHDYAGCEGIYFNINEFKKVLKRIASGETIIKFGNTVLYCASQDKFDNAIELGCHKVIHTVK